MINLIQISVAISLDGYIDDKSHERLVLSSPQDLEDMYACRAENDAILVGAETVRRDDPSMIFKDPRLVKERIDKGLPPELTKVTLTRSGNLNAKSKFFATGEAKKIVFCSPSMRGVLQQSLGAVADCIPLDELEPISILAALEQRNIQRIFIEGGTSVLTQFISAGLFHRLRLAVAPFFVGDSGSARFVSSAKFLNDKKNRLQLVRCRKLGDTTVMEFINEQFPLIQ
jgi:5-amino-6-(5-phosphoribosylamino)uracil reductase